MGPSVKFVSCINGSFPPPKNGSIFFSENCFFQILEYTEDTTYMSPSWTALEGKYVHTVNKTVWPGLVGGWDGGMATLPTSAYKWLMQPAAWYVTILSSEQYTKAQNDLYREKWWGEISGFCSKLRLSVSPPCLPTLEYLIPYII